MALEKIVEKPVLETVPKSSSEKPQTPDNKDRSVGDVHIIEKQKTTTSAEKQSVVIAPPLSVNSVWQQQRAQAIDLILAEGLNDVFMKMSPADQKAFQLKGEETVVKINELLNKTKINLGKIIDLIKAWLKMVPGINKFFLEQEAKIKADKIIRLKDKF